MTFVYGKKIRLVLLKTEVLSDPINGINQPLAKAISTGNEANDIGDRNGEEKEKNRIHPNLRMLFTPYPDH